MDSFSRVLTLNLAMLPKKIVKAVLDTPLGPRRPSVPFIHKAIPSMGSSTSFDEAMYYDEEDAWSLHEMDGPDMAPAPPPTPTSPDSESEREALVKPIQIPSNICTNISQKIVEFYPESDSDSEQTLSDANDDASRARNTLPAVNSFAARMKFKRVDWENPCDEGSALYPPPRKHTQVRIIADDDLEYSPSPRRCTIHNRVYPCFRCEPSRWEL
ncbi:hypothetical protein BDQ12DRAFT_250744 [Crucibulum laeve]|uniref:Uncharacterized protein n=1 Tax=Crucibulum laeve TaxID=68775 RepID=A0A5C3LX17_9AGAR|nr:hypothetical protein BDQ12DRAFT_250744 [Crucibulum laeve]